jgi:hypothetical protein
MRKDAQIINSNTVKMDKTLLNVYFQVPKKIVELLVKESVLNFKTLAKRFKI